MGVLGQMTSRDLASRLPENSPAEKKQPVEKSIPSPPAVPCEKCGSLQFWLDAYGNWNCGGCTPPRVLAMIRQDYTIDPNAETIQINDETWVRRQDCEGTWGWELAGLLERARWWARCTFEELPSDLLAPYPNGKIEKAANHGR